MYMLILSFVIIDDKHIIKCNDEVVVVGITHINNVEH